MVSEPRVSVITVVKDHLEGLRQTFSSLEKLSWDNIQYIVINGSQSPEKAKEIMAMTRKIDILVNESDLGVYDAMNKGLRLCDGEWVHFLNAGDVYLQAGALNEVTSCMKSDLDFVFCDVMREFMDGQRRIWSQSYPWRYGIFRNICHQAVWYNLNKNPGLKYDLNYRISADCHLLLQLSLKEDFECFYYPKALTTFKMGGLSQQFAALALRERWQSFDENLRNPMVKAINQINLLRQMFKLKKRKWKDG